MRIVRCPECESLSVESLEQLSKDAWVNYYRCPDCGHLWSVWKDERFAETVGVAQSHGQAPKHENQRFLELRKFLEEQFDHLDLAERTPRAMPHPACPACLSTRVRWLAETSKRTYVDYYYRCGDCGHVWSVPKNNPDAKPRHMKPLSREHTPPTGILK